MIIGPNKVSLLLPLLNTEKKSLMVSFQSYEAEEHSVKNMETKLS